MAHDQIGHKHTAARVVSAAVSTAAALSLIGPAVLAVGSPTSAAAPVRATFATAKASIKTATVKTYGEILENSKGLPLYYDSANKPGHWACTGSCLSAWPPVLLAKGQSKPTVAKGVPALSSVKGPSGWQVTWDGKALYTFEGDSAGKVNGNGLGDFFVVKVKGAATSSTEATPTTTPAVTTTTAAGAW